jgi:hypothetical protein
MYLLGYNNIFRSKLHFSKEKRVAAFAEPERGSVSRSSADLQKISGLVEKLLAGDAAAGHRPALHLLRGLA